jgi:hypothetical protein
MRPRHHLGAGAVQLLPVAVRHLQEVDVLRRVHRQHRAQAAIGRRHDLVAGPAGGAQQDIGTRRLLGARPALAAHQEVRRVVPGMGLAIDDFHGCLRAPA